MFALHTPLRALVVEAIVVVFGGFFRACPETAPRRRAVGGTHALTASLSAGVVPRHGAVAAHTQKHIIDDPCASTACHDHHLCGVGKPQNHPIDVLGRDVVAAGGR